MPPSLLQDFLDYLRSIRGSSEGTIKEYNYDLTHMLRFLAKRISKVDTDGDDFDLSICDTAFHQSIRLIDLHAFLGYLDRECNNSASSRARKTSAMRSYFGYLTDKVSILSTNPAAGLETPKKKNRHPVYLTLDESVRLLKQTQELENDMIRTRDYAIILLFLTCGFRLSELSQINIEDIKGDMLNVIGKGNKERTIFLTEAVREAIADWLRYRPAVDREPALFLSTRKSRMCNRAIQFRIEKHLYDAGFDTTLYSTHKLRHTAATLMYKHGSVDIRTLQQVLGHESVATTQIYTHTDDEQLRAAVTKNPLSNFQI